MFEFVPHRDTIFLCLAGSHAHGTAQEESDVDIRGVGIAPIGVRISYCQEFEQFEGALDSRVRLMIEAASKKRGIELDQTKDGLTIFDVAKFFRLCAAANPNCLEILFADERDWLFESLSWRKIWERRSSFLSRRVAETYSGYAIAQLKKIRSHRSWLLTPPTRQRSRRDFGLPDAMSLNAEDRNRIEEAIAGRLRQWTVEDLDMPSPTRIALRERLEDLWREVMRHQEASTGEVEHVQYELAAGSLGIPRELVDVLRRERKFRGAQRQWNSYQTWLSERNEDRAELERQFGYDTKHAMHLVRLMRTGLQLLSSGTFDVRRPDAEELLEIRRGSLTYEQLVEEADHLHAKIHQAVDRSALPKSPNDDEIDSLLLDVIEAGRNS